MLDNVNPIFWLLQLALLMAWARFAVFVSHDLHENMSDQPELPWNIGLVGVLMLMLLITLAIPIPLLGLILNAVLGGGAYGGYYALRVKTMGTDGHLFGGVVKTATNVSRKIEARASARQVQLTYLRHDSTPMPLPPPGDPMAAGLGTADAIVIQALLRRSETVDLAPAQNGYSLTMTTDGVVTQQPALERAAAEFAVQAFKVLAGLAAEERRRPQTGQFRSRDAEGTMTIWTVRTSGSVAGERAILSANENGQWDLPLEQLGMTSDQLADVKKLASDTKGIVIVTAPRGHGRTATMYALLRQHDAFTNSVQTLELNPQAEIEGVTMNRFDSRVGPDASFSKMLQQVTLKEPNVLLVAQVPDTATADVITKYASAESSEGHRIYMALNAGDSFSAIEQWLALNSSANKLHALNALRAVVAQRLVRILCPTCKIPYQPDEATMKKMNLPVGRNLQSFKANTEPIVDRKGNSITCPDCGGVGYKGRTGIFEILMITDEMKKALAAGGSINQLKVLARKNNLLLLVEHGIRRFATGVTAIHEVTRVLTPPGGGASGRSSVNKVQE